MFSGAGGLDIGFEAAGFRTLACVEKDPAARRTLAHNRPDWRLLAADVHDVDPRAAVASLGTGSAGLDLLLAGPPCQPFSKAALWRGGETPRLRDPRSATLSATMDFVEAALPRAVVIENVTAIAKEGKGEALALIEDRFAAVNRSRGTRYRPAVTVLSATSFGVPQQRERAFIVAFEDGSDFVPPQPTHGPGLSPFATAWDAMGPTTECEDELAELAPSGKWADLLGTVPAGSNYLHHTARGAGVPLFGWRTRYWTFLLKLSPSAPSWTLQAVPGPATGPFHWESRSLSRREMAALQTFPAGYEIQGSHHAVRKQVGNAVPSALAEAVARSVRATLDGTFAFVGGRTLAVPPRPGTPKPPPAAPVPDRFMAMVGEHAEHPGHGKGPGAALRASGRPEGSGVRP